MTGSAQKSKRSHAVFRPSGSGLGSTSTIGFRCHGKLSLVKFTMTGPAKSTTQTAAL